MREYIMSVGGKEFHASIKELNADYALVQVDNQEYKVILKQLGSGQSVFSGLTRGASPVTSAVTGAAPIKEVAQVVTPPLPGASGSAEGSGIVMAPLPGLILDLFVQEGSLVKAGQNLLVMEAMKMENQIQAPFDGTVKKIFVQKGASVCEGDKLIEISRPFMTTL